MQKQEQVVVRNVLQEHIKDQQVNLVVQHVQMENIH